MISSPAQAPSYSTRTAAKACECEATRLLRLDAERVELTGIAVATMQQQQLGGMDIAAGSTAAAEGSTVVTKIGRDIVVYRIQ